MQVLAWVRLIGDENVGLVGTVDTTILSDDLNQSAKTLSSPVCVKV